MKKLCLLCVWMFCAQTASAQDTLRRGVEIGIDIFKSVWPRVGLYDDLRSAYTTEPTISLPLRQPSHWLHITPGFTRFRERDYPTINSSTLSGWGYYLKVGVERRKGPTGIGGSGLLTAWRDEGTYRFVGSYFGNYIGSIPPRNRMAIGAELFISILQSIKKRLMIRFQPRVSLLGPFGGQGERPNPAFLPGVGLSEGGRWRVSSGVSVQLFYRTLPNRP